MSREALAILLLIYGFVLPYGSWKRFRKPGEKAGLITAMLQPKQYLRTVGLIMYWAGIALILLGLIMRFLPF